MSDRTTINVTKEAHRKASEAKTADESWSDYITRCINEPNPEESEPINEVDRSEVADELEALRDMVSMIPEPGAFATEEDVQKLMNRIDDLETELTTQHERMEGR